MMTAPTDDLNSITGRAANSDTGYSENESGDLKEGSIHRIQVDTVSTGRAALDSGVSFRVYKRRWAGLVGFVVLNAVAAMSWPWFGPISNNMAAEFHLSLTQVNWLGNIVSCIYLPTALLIPFVFPKWGIRICCYVGAVCLLISAWVRYAATVGGLSTHSAYALLLVGQTFAAFAQPCFQVLGPLYSERWFDLKGRTTATMLMAISNPIGGALGQLISPIPTNTNKSILILGIISTAAIPFVFLIGEAPPTAPTYSGSKDPTSFVSLLRALLGRHAPNTEAEAGSYMSIRERLDFCIIFIVFGVLVGQSSAFAILTGEIFGPYGYSSTLCGIFGAVLLISGLVAAAITSPLVDRVFTHHLALIAKIFIPCVGILWLSLIWAAKSDNTAGIFVIMALLGASSVPILPIALELVCEISRNSDGSSALLWFNANLFAVIFVLVQGALADSAASSPPYSMHRALVFTGAFILVICCFILLLHGKQTRRELDVMMNMTAVPRSNANAGDDTDTKDVNVDSKSVAHISMVSQA